MAAGALLADGTEIHAEVLHNKGVHPQMRLAAALQAYVNLVGRGIKLSDAEDLDHIQHVGGGLGRPGKP